MKRFAFSISLTLGAGSVLAQGAPETIPGGPYGENESLASLRSYDQLVHAIAAGRGHGSRRGHAATCAVEKQHRPRRCPTS